MGTPPDGDTQLFKSKSTELPPISSVPVRAKPDFGGRNSCLSWVSPFASHGVRFVLVLSIAVLVLVLVLDSILRYPGGS